VGIYDEFIKERSLREFLSFTNISVKNKYIYFAISKVANSTIKYYLQQIEYEGTPYRVKNVHDKHCSPLLSPYQLTFTDFIDALTSDIYKRFVFVRNPYCRVLSCYLDRIQDPKSNSYKNIRTYLGKDPREISFGEFLEAISLQNPKEMDSHWRPQVFESLNGHVKMDKIFFFEQLPKNLKDLSIFLYGEKKRIFNDVVNKSPSRTSANNLIFEYFQPDLVNLTYKIYRRDFVAFGYSSDITITNSQLERELGATINS
jgi:hypothetical protein